MIIRYAHVEYGTPKYYHTTEPCFVQLSEFDEEITTSTARNWGGMTKCPDCEREERRNATVQPHEPSFPESG